jgi:hypothetical protein
MIAWLPLDVIVAAFSGGVLLYSAFLLVPTAQAYLTEIAHECFPKSPSSVGMAFPRFPNAELPYAVERYASTGVGLETLVAGTLGGVVASILAALPLPRPTGWVQTVAPAGVAFAVGLLLSRAYHTLKQRERRERAAWYSFLVWLKYNACAKSYENLRVVVGKTAADSGFMLLEECIKKNRSNDREALWEAILQEVLRRARQRLVRRDNESLRQWADEIAAFPRIEPRR